MSRDAGSGMIRCMIIVTRVALSCIDHVVANLCWHFASVLDRVKTKKYYMVAQYAITEKDLLAELKTPS